ncbi:hypothetical protein NWI01_27920 [Nitrobacter winogradskyi]|uniref:Uncharacterized protein n=1 Tax=Nitrobacter winogradskyi TaxID=913 RepID=A0A4Y3WFL6_NITWI|nr:hypothetical protein NWI01_27920 [Nitrobacter winogradskyi]
MIFWIGQILHHADGRSEERADDKSGKYKREDSTPGGAGEYETDGQGEQPAKDGAGYNAKCTCTQKNRQDSAERGSLRYADDIGTDQGIAEQSLENRPR